MNLLTHGTWWLKSKDDPRWDCVGRSSVGGFVMPKECGQKIAKLENKLGDKPVDLTWRYEKD